MDRTSGLVIDDPLNLAIGNIQGGKALEDIRSLSKGRVHRTCPTHELNSGWSVLLMKSELFVQRETTALRSDVVSPPQVDRTEECDHLSVSHGVKLLLGTVSVHGEQARQLVIQKLLHESGGIFLHGGPQQGLKPCRIKLLFAKNFLLSDLQELRNFSALCHLYRLGFFLLSASSRIAACSIKVNNSSKIA